MTRSHTPHGTRLGIRRPALVAAATLLAGSVLLTACGGSGSSSSDAGSGAGGSASSAAPNLGLISNGTIQAATQSDQYPFAFVGTDGKQQGFSIDLVDEIAKRLGVKVTYKALSLDPLLSGIEAKQYDTAAVGLSVTPARAAQMGFTEAFYYGYFGVLVKKGSTLTASSLAGKTLAVVTGSAQVDYAKEHYASSSVKAFPSQSSALAALLGGQVDAFFLGGPDTVKYLKQNPSLSLAASIPTGSENAFPVPKDHTELTAAMNKELDAMFDDGTYTKLYKKWFTQPIPTQLVTAHPSLKAS